MERKELIYQTLYRAAAESFAALFKAHPEHYYYAALIMMDAQTVCITAMSEEALAQLETDDRWSYGDSPYTGFAHKTYFNDVDTLFQKDVWNADLTDEALERRVADWQRIMRKVMLALSEDGAFSAYPDLFRNAEAFPPEGTYNWKNAKKLNAPAVFKRWKQDNPEEDDEADALCRYYQECHHPTLCSITLKKPLPSKTMAAALRRDFASPLTIREFLKACESLPFEISAGFRHKEALTILAAHPEYTKYLDIIVLPKNS